MEKMVKAQGGVPAVVVGLALFIILYSLWGASLLNAQEPALSQNQTPASL